MLPAGEENGWIGNTKQLPVDGGGMKPGFTMAEAATHERQIGMRKKRIMHLNKEMIRIQDCIRIMDDEISELEKLI